LSSFLFVILGGNFPLLPSLPLPRIQAPYPPLPQNMRQHPFGFLEEGVKATFPCPPLRGKGGVRGVRRGVKFGVSFGKASRREILFYY